MRLTNSNLLIPNSRNLDPKQAIEPGTAGAAMDAAMIRTCPARYPPGDEGGPLMRDD